MTTLVREEPFAAAVESVLLQNVCHSCFKYTPGKQLRCCSRCSVVRYCSQKCQRSDWLDHSAECRCLKNYLPRVPSGFVRLLARFYWKTSAQGRTVTSFNSRRCSDLLNNCEKLIKSEKHVEYFSSLFKILLEYMHGTDVANSRKELFSAYGQIITNAFSITDITFVTLGTGLYLGISAQNHSCVPDVFVYFEGSTAVMRSPEEGKKYDHNAVERNLNARMELESTQALNTMSAVEVFEHWFDVFQKYVKMLSPYNKFMVGICQRFLAAAENAGNTDILSNFAEISLNAYRRYLPLGHPELTQRLQLALKWKLTSCSHDKCRDLLEEAYNSALHSHGKEHPVTKELSVLLNFD